MRLPRGSPSAGSTRSSCAARAPSCGRAASRPPLGVRRLRHARRPAPLPEPARPRRSSRRPIRQRAEGHVACDEAARAARRHDHPRPARPVRRRPRGRDRRRRDGRRAAFGAGGRRRRRSARRAGARRRRRAGSARSGRSSSTRCSTRTPPATSRSAAASRSPSTARTTRAREPSGTHVDFMIGSPELEVDGSPPRGSACPSCVGGDWQI